MLTEMGWNVSDPSITAFGKTAPTGKRIDYVLGGVMAVEVKTLGGPLDRHVDQLVQYGSELDLKYGVLTNGRNWWVYDLRPSDPKLVAEFNVMSHGDDLVANTVKRLRQMFAAALAGDIPPDPPSVTAPPVEPGGWIPVAMVDYEWGMAPPVALRCGGVVMPLTSWFGMLTGVARWLVDNRHLGAQDCPIWAGPGEAILHTGPFHPYGRPFAWNYEYFRSHGVDDGFCLNHVGPLRTLRHSVLLIQAARRMQQSFEVYFLGAAGRQDPQ